MLRMRRRVGMRKTTTRKSTVRTRRRTTTRMSTVRRTNF